MVLTSTYEWRKKHIMIFESRSSYLVPKPYPPAAIADLLPSSKEAFRVHAVVDTPAKIVTLYPWASKIIEKTQQRRQRDGSIYRRGPMRPKFMNYLT